MSCCQYNPQLSKFHFLIMFFERDLGLMNSPGNFCHLVLHVLVWMCRELTSCQTTVLGIKIGARWVAAEEWNKDYNGVPMGVQCTSRLQGSMKMKNGMRERWDEGGRDGEWGGNQAGGWRGPSGGQTASIRKQTVEGRGEREKGERIYQKVAADKDGTTQEERMAEGLCFLYNLSHHPKLTDGDIGITSRVDWKSEDYLLAIWP